ncbi:MAG: protease modulator HflC [Lentisphaeria bacterium]
MKQKLGFMVMLAVVAVAVLVGVIVLASSAYTVDEAEQAVVLQFGKPIGETITEPGLHFKMPFVQDVRRFDKRLLVWDGDPNQIPTRGREYISIETTGRWKIVDALRLLESVNDESGAQSRLDDIIDSVVRDKISSTELVEIVRSSDWEVSEKDLEQVKDMKSGEKQEELTREVRMGRQKLTRNILAEASKGMPEKYGIELVDVRISRLNYIPSVREQVFNRMISERQRIAEQFRSEGQGEASRIRGETSRDLARIRSEAKRKAEVIRGEADADATQIYNEAYSADPEFYKFSRTLESYADSLSEKTILVIGADSEYFEYFRGIELD